MEQDLLKCFPDKPPRVQTRIAEVIDLLSQDGRISLSAVAQELNLPISTVYEYMKVVRKRLHIRTVFSINYDAIPRPWFRCPECKSRNTTPETLYNPVTGKTKITGLLCRDCNAQARRGQLSPTLVKAMEA